MLDDEGVGALFKLVGYAQTDLPAPTFLIPVFKNLDDDKICIQMVGDDETIVSFVVYSSPYISTTSNKAIFRKPHQRVIFGFVSLLNDVFFGERDDFTKYLMHLLAKGEFEQHPALGVNVAKFVGAADEQLRLKKKVFEQTPVDLEKTRKFFLENNVVRESLLDGLPIESHDIIRRTKISIFKNKISLGTPLDALESLKRELASNVSQTFRDFMNSPDVEVNFQSQDDRDGDTLGDIYSIRAGGFDYRPVILDCPKVKHHFSPRESIALIPQAAHIFRTSRSSKSSVVKNYFQPKTRFYTIADDTIKKIISLDSVSLISAILFRLRIMGNSTDALADENFTIHIACFKIDREKVSDVVMDRLVRVVHGRELHSVVNGDYANTLMPLSMIGLLHKRGLLSIVDIERSVFYSRNGYFSPSVYNEHFLSEWVSFCAAAAPIEYQYIQSHIEFPSYFDFGLDEEVLEK